MLKSPDHVNIVYTVLKKIFIGCFTIYRHGGEFGILDDVVGPREQTYIPYLTRGPVMLSLGQAVVDKKKIQAKCHI